MQTVGELHQDDTDVVRHAHDDLTERLGLQAFGAFLKVLVGEFGHSVNNLRHLIAKVFFDIV